MKPVMRERIMSPEETSGVTGRTARNPSFELLRVVAMLMIVTLHMNIGGMGNILEEVIPCSANFFLAWGLEIYCLVAVNCFVLITGYFMCEQKFKTKRLLLLWLQIVFYTIAIYLVFVGMGKTTFQVSALIKSFLPISLKTRWFVTVYFLLCCVAPVLNITIAAISKAQHRNCLAALLLIFSFWATAAGVSDFTDVSMGYSLPWFMILYLIAGYIKKYRDVSKKASFWLGLYLGTGLLISIAKAGVSALTQRMFGQIRFAFPFFIYNSPLILLESIFLFMFFANLTIKNKRLCRIICALAPLSLGVLIIHANEYVRTIWVPLLHPATYANSPWMIPYVFFCTFCLYFFCVAIDAVRQQLFKPLQRMTWPDRLLEKAEKLLDR
ncbi:MAG: acyltransferase [Eubacteriales bacterium]|nr:acyltransferase [Eubacteriales bacterium]